MNDTSIQSSEEPARLATKKHRILVLTAICMGVFLSHFTAGVVNVSLPHLTKVFQTDLGTVQWITTGYLLVIASLLPLMGKLGDRYGHRFIHNLGYVFFCVSSVLVAFSSTVSILLVFRMIQAVGAAMFQATNIALITVLIPKEKRGRALGIVSTAVAIGGMTGPIAGGLIAVWFSWQWLFLIHVPVALVATWVAFRYIPAYGHHGQEKKYGPLDRLGALLFLLVIAPMIIAISNGNAWGWGSMAMMVLYAIVLFALTTLLLWESRQNAPFLPIQVFRIPAVSSGLLISCSSFLLANLVLVVIPFYLSGMAQVSPVTIGYGMTAYPLLLAVMGPIAGYSSDRYRPRTIMLGGLCAMGAGLAVLAMFLEHMSLVEMIGVMALIGAGMGLTASPNINFIMSHVPLEHAGSIGGMIALTRNAGLVFGAALGLGLMNGGSYPEMVTDFHAYRAIFKMGGLICLASILVLGYSVLVERRRN